jgi:hypothetical protein
MNLDLVTNTCQALIRESLMCRRNQSVSSSTSKGELLGCQVS